MAASSFGPAYGYRIERRWDEKGKMIGGLHSIYEPEAIIVRRICREYASGASPRAIAIRLNAEGIPATRGGTWRESTICGNKRRGTGVLNNERYRGVLVWNRQQYSVDPNTGRGNSRLNDETVWIRSNVEHLRIVSEELWSRVKAKQKELESAPYARPVPRPKYLLSQLVKCGDCGGGYSKVSQSQYGCSRSRNGACGNKLTVSRGKLEETILGALRKRLVDPGLFEIFCQEYVAHINRLASRETDAATEQKAELTRLNREIGKFVDAIKRGVDAAVFAVELNALHDRKRRLESLPTPQSSAPVFIHPNMAKRYRDEVCELVTSLNNPEFRDRSIAVIRSLIEKVVLIPKPDRSELSIDLHGNLAGILCVASGRAITGPCPSLNLTERQEIDQVKMVINGTSGTTSGNVGATRSLPPQPVLR